jgi:hypothetical protein
LYPGERKRSTTEARFKGPKNAIGMHLFSKFVSHAIENLFVVRMDVGIIRYARPKLEYILSHAASRFS